MEVVRNRYFSLWENSSEIYGVGELHISIPPYRAARDKRLPPSSNCDSIRFDERVKRLTVAYEEYQFYQVLRLG